MTWKPDERTIKTFGDYSVVSERRGSDTAHLISFPDGRKVRVLPDPDTSGQKRSRIVSEALADLQGWDEAKAALYKAGMRGTRAWDALQRDPFVQLVGVLDLEGLAWEVPGPGEVTIEEWLAEWFECMPPTEAATAADDLIKDLETTGWKIVRKEEGR